MTMTPEQRTELIALIADTAALTTIQTGYVDTSNIVRHDGLLILDACPTVVYEVIDWVRQQKGALGAPSLITASLVDWQSGPGLHSRTRGLLIR
jgi:hypothetical protein